MAKKTRGKATAPIKKSTTNKIYIEDYYSVISGKKEVANMEVIENLAEELLKYCNANPYASMVRFAHSKGIPWSTFCDWKNRFEVLKGPTMRACWILPTLLNQLLLQEL